MLGNTDFIGIDIGQYAIKIARVKGGKSFTATPIAYEVLTDENKSGEGLKTLITNLLKYHKITKGQPVVHVSISDAIMRNVNVPENTSKDGLEGAVELELSPALPFPIDQVYFDFDPNPVADGSYLAVASRRDLIDQKTGLFANRAKTLNSPQVDIDAFAFERLVEGLTLSGNVAGQNIGILDIGLNRSRMLIYQNGEFVFSREPQIGGQQVNEIIRDVYDISLADAENRKLNHNFSGEYNDLVLTPYATSLSEQINLAVDFYEASSEKAGRLDGLYLTGGGSQLQGLIEYLQSSVNIPVSGLSLGNHLKGSSQLGDGLNYGLAIGLAMEGK